MLYIVRGLPGSGKSTLAAQLAPGAAFATDDYFYNDAGVYRFDAAKLREAHADCQQWAQAALSRGVIVAVANTFSRLWEMEPYLKMAAEREIPVTILEVQTPLTDDELAARNMHGVPADVIRRMRARWEKFPTT